MFQGNVLFGQISQSRIDEFQRREEYTECCQLYESSQLDCNNPDVRAMKITLYHVLRDYLIYDPVLDKWLGSSEWERAVSVFDRIAPGDPDYANKMTAVLSTVYYCVKNRGFNYTLASNASIEEINLADYLRDWLENHSARIINRSTQVAGVLAALMVLLYDKIGTATVKLVHIGEDVPVGVDFRSIGNGRVYGEIEYRNTTRSMRNNALGLIGMERYRHEYGTRRNYWRSMVQNKQLRECENTFLYGCCNVAQINQFLSRYHFHVLDICTQYYENYFSKLPSIFSFHKKLLYMITGSSEKSEAEKRKSRDFMDFSFKQMVLSFARVFLPCLIVAVVCLVLFVILMGEEGIAIGSVVAIVISVYFLSPFYSRSLEKKKRKKYSIYNW